jgi:hypothetical protein
VVNQNQELYLHSQNNSHIEISFKTFKEHSFKRQIRNYNAADIEGLADEMNITNWNDLVFNSDNITDVYSNSKNGGGSLALVKFDMDLAILHHFPGGISLFERSEVSLFLYSSFAFLTKSITSNTHFSNIANIDNEPVISDNVTPLPCHLNEFIITEQEILDQLKILNVNKPAGPDEYPCLKVQR